VVKLKFSRLRSFTILETMVALTIALFMFGLMASLFEKINKNAYSSRQLKAHELLKTCALAMKDSASADISDIPLVGFLVKRRFLKIDTLPGVLKWHLVIYDESGRELDQTTLFIQADDLEGQPQ
jgi:hypothetical protein